MMGLVDRLNEIADTGFLADDHTAAEDLRSAARLIESLREELDFARGRLTDGIGNPGQFLILRVPNRGHSVVAAGSPESALHEWLHDFPPLSAEPFRLAVMRREGVFRIEPAGSHRIVKES